MPAARKEEAGEAQAPCRSELNQRAADLNVTEAPCRPQPGSCYPAPWTLGCQAQTPSSVETEKPGRHLHPLRGRTGLVCWCRQAQSPEGAWFTSSGPPSTGTRVAGGGGEAYVTGPQHCASLSDCPTPCAPSPACGGAGLPLQQGGPFPLQGCGVSNGTSGCLKERTFTQVQVRAGAGRKGLPTPRSPCMGPLTPLMKAASGAPSGHWREGRVTCPGQKGRRERVKVTSTCMHAWVFLCEYVCVCKCSCVCGCSCMSARV